MLILSSSRYLLGSRVSCNSSSTPPFSSPSSYSVSVRFDTGRSRSSCPCFCSSSSGVHGMTELLKGTNRENDSNNDKDNIAASSLGVGEGESRCTTFLTARSGQELLSGIRKKKEVGRLPPDIASRMEELYYNYRNAVINSGVMKADEIVLSNMSLALDRIFLDVEEPFDFASYHKAKRHPFDYYMFVQNYIRPLVDFRNSYVGNMAIFYEMDEQLQQGHNIILISNHQTEADPAVIALLLETSLPRLAEDLTYIAGDRVITDPLCKPFSMGRNLVCVYSKKHMNDDPELTEMKRRANTKSLKEMAVLLRGGSQIIWIAPSGGRDRPDPETGEWYPAPFDSSSVDNMRRLVEYAGVPGHIYPLTLLCYDIMPPPPKVEKAIGEKRLISFHGAGLSVGREISFQAIADSCQNPQEEKEAYTQALYESVTEQYTVLRSAVHGKQGLKASSPTTCLSQPWS